MTRKIPSSNRATSWQASIAILAMLQVMGGRHRHVLAWSLVPSRTILRRKLGSSISNSQLTSIPERIGIIGGGLAGLSTAYHLVQRIPDVDITILDKTMPGLGGASSVAGGLLHPLSPQGKLVHLGLEGLHATNTLLNVSMEYEKGCILQDELYRVAVNHQHLEVLMETADRLPRIAEWIPRQQLPWMAQEQVLGALRLHSGCKVVHVPSYLKGLYQAIQSTGNGSKEWIVIGNDSDTKGLSLEERTAAFDAIVLAAGSGLFQDSIITDKMPIQLVRGQSIEMTLKDLNLKSAMLCGKYVSPLLEENRVLIGATHEFKEQALDDDQVRSELRERTDDFAADIWEDGTIDKITCGFRVQSNRGKYGRMPLLGKYDCAFHPNAWIFTGLSSRGLLHHGIFGEILARKIIGDETELFDEYLHWWQGRTSKQE